MTVGGGVAADRRIWRLDTKALVGGVLLGVVLVLLNQVTARVDAIVNPSAGLFSGTTWAIISALTVRLFRQPAGIIAGEIQAFVAIATASNPLAPSFLITNALGPLFYSVALRIWPGNSWLDHFLTQAVQNLVGDLVFLVAVMTLLQVPFAVAFPAIVLTFVVNWIASSLITKPLADTVERSGVAD
jgi:hypothetical protein